MFRGLKPASEVGAVIVKRTEGDFPHVRRGGVLLACCTTTTCCITFVAGAAGGVIGLVVGIVHSIGIGSAQPVSQNAAANFALASCRMVLMAISYAVVGLLAGAAIGFVFDMLIGGR